MTNAEIRKYQTAQAYLLREFDKLCRQLQISYYMIGGTLLGAVRHGGFIPWDADIDIAMRREDYERFKAHWMAHPSDTYFYEDYETEKNHMMPHALFRLKGTCVCDTTRVSPYYAVHEKGIFLDIFPLDTPPKSPVLQKIQMHQIRFIRWLIKLKIGYYYPDTPTWKKAAKRFAHGCVFPFSLQRLNRMLDKAMRKYSGSDSGFLVSMASHYSYWKQLMPEAIYGTPIPCVFENQSYSAPAQIDAYLKQIYGNYMKLPPENKRVFPCKISEIDYGALEKNDDYQRFAETL